LEMKSWELFVWAGLETWSSQSQFPKVRITSVGHRQPARTPFEGWIFSGKISISFVSI
jgi:hypothetical protein